MEGKATRKDTQWPALEVADSHDLIRVHGARVNNLKDVSVALPKHRLTVFTGVSGSGKSSLVFDTIAAESQRLINETYSAFVQGFMPTLARPDVDVMDGLTTAIIVDQQRMGGDPRSTVGTATDQERCCASCSAGWGSRTSARPRRSRSMSLPSRARGRSASSGREDGEGATELQHHRRHVPTLRGPRRRQRHRPHRAERDGQRLRAMIEARHRGQPPSGRCLGVGVLRCGHPRSSGGRRSRVDSRSDDARTALSSPAARRRASSGCR